MNDQEPDSCRWGLCWVAKGFVNRFVAPIPLLHSMEPCRKMHRNLSVSMPVDLVCQKSGSLEVTLRRRLDRQGYHVTPGNRDTEFLEDFGAAQEAHHE